ncbi:tRNA epoxyqueuosine(34) reductase QueG [Galenea microaerophila]
MMPQPNQSLAQKIKQWGLSLGFADVGITQPDLSQYEPHYFDWLKQGYHGTMDYMSRHGTKRTRPSELVPGTLSLISVRYPYYRPEGEAPTALLHQADHAYISRYALGRDYHKLMRKKLQQLAEKIKTEVPELQYRAFSDSAPVLERPIAEQAGLGFIGKNSLIIHPRAGSWFFLGELFVNIELPADPPFTQQGCGPCTACIVECPTQAIVDNGVVDSRRCISYLTIEYSGVIERELSEKMGNRIYGCDDCQLVCPWNRFAEWSQEADFSPRHQLDKATLLDLWQWEEQQFLDRMAGSPIRRIGYQQWLRNLAIALGNSDLGPTAIKALQQKIHKADAVARTHIEWSIEKLVRNEKNAKIPSPAPQKRPIRPFKAKKYYLPLNIPRKKDLKFTSTNKG